MSDAKDLGSLVSGVKNELDKHGIDITPEKALEYAKTAKPIVEGCINDGKFDASKVISNIADKAFSGENKEGGQTK